MQLTELCSCLEYGFIWTVILKLWGLWFIAGVAGDWSSEVSSLPLQDWACCVDLGFPGPTWWQPREGSWVELKGWSRLIWYQKAKAPQPMGVCAGAFLHIALSSPKKEQPPIMTFREALGTDGFALRHPWLQGWLSCVLFPRCLWSSFFNLMDVQNNQFWQQLPG